MAVEAELLKRIMGMPDSPTGKLVALRKTPGAGELETGVWYSNFTRVKEEAERRKIPFFALWTNGDLCGFCIRFTKNILEPVFMSKMKTSGGLWWLGGSMDDSEEDRRGGKGFTWCLGPDRKVNYFPLFAVRHAEGEHSLFEFFGSGHDYDLRKEAPEGTVHIIDKIRSIFSSGRRPERAPVHTDTLALPGTSPFRIRVNPAWDSAHVARFHAALAANGGHCVCQRDRTADSLCLCRSFMDQNTPGLCHCGAYEKYIP